MTDPGPASDAEISAFLTESPATTAICFDFDGTLAPIVDDPSAASAVPGAADRLEELSARYATVAVISGRPRSFLVEHLGPGVDLSGLYGLEVRRDGVPADHPDAARWRTVIDEVVAEADALRVEGGGGGGGGIDASIASDGVVFEPKGLSLTVHFRQAPDAASAVDEWARSIADRTGLVRRAAKQSVELHPPVDVDKGTSLEALVGGCDRVAFFGDDLGDLPAFEALDRLRAGGMATLKVAVASSELPAEVADAADVVVAGPAAIMALLGSLLDQA